jgi:transposase
VLRIEQITDNETLRQAALLLDRENRRLHDKIRELAEEIARLKGQDASAAQVQLEFLKELLARREHALFGDKSERRMRQADETGNDPAASPRSGHGPKAQPKLPIVEQFHELDPADCTCPKCGKQLDEMAGQTEDSEEITIVERGFVLVRHRRKKYRCSCNGHVETAPAPLRLASRSDRRGRRYSIDFAVEVAIGKYLDHLPLERQARIMRREGLDVDSQTLWDQIAGLARPLRPTLDALLGRLFSEPVLGADETWWRLMKGRGSKRWWVWSLSGQDAVVYRILDSRSQAAARQVLGDYDGIVIADGYSVYDALARAGPKSFTLVNCWSHARRKLIEAEPFEPDRCKEVLDLIRDLYAVERECPVPGPLADEATREAALAQRGRLRDSRSREIVEAIRAWALAQRALPESTFGKAIAYMLGLWPGLTRFLDDPRIPIDNNHTERGLRGVVVGRKNHYGSRSKRGTEVAALFYSLIESAKLAGVDPKAYLRAAARTALADPGAVLLPHELLTPGA